MSNRKGTRNLAVICTILLFVFLVSASAHSGRTDANGGHWNRSTGEYHYHTGEYAGRSSSGSSTKRTEKSSTYKAPTKSTDSTTPKKEKITFREIAKFILAIFLGFFPIIVPLLAYIVKAIISFIEYLSKRK